ncbi:SdpI family protein [Aridibaculum aurantiacum]|uniref:SdpI family protein n=1 Tax=Aridibaculum aurantiacum TaxID=2810307 RepID=UPI001A96185A|nr:SdpI family protein [Aridibaculum aurantiacum]
MKKTGLYVFAFLVILIPWIYLLMAWSQMAETVPTHFGLDGEPDDFGSKASVLLLPLGMITITGIGIFLLLMNIHRIDPKRQHNSPELVARIGLGILIFMAVIGVLIVDSARSGALHFDKILLPLMGFFFAFLGSTFTSLKPNYFIGLRTPWALEDDNNWQYTHKLAAKYWMAGGLLAAVISLFLPFETSFIVFFVIILLIAGIPFYCSYRFYKRTKAHKLKSK